MPLKLEAISRRALALGFCHSNRSNVEAISRRALALGSCHPNPGLAVRPKNPSIKRIWEIQSARTKSVRIVGMDDDAPNLEGGGLKALQWFWERTLWEIENQPVAWTCFMLIVALLVGFVACLIVFATHWRRSNVAPNKAGNP